ncbi:STAS domain-containing protein [Planosporangium thailandense]|uniref:Anti-sigma factor antagonist n=1 Tax=Planosporangium thailandense TaxID=765197 RepID=A0ABX0Y420_9ACTN|nr:STAS domain-containing protein [Planosporangium thailandense]NJC73139.1 STAS domain-containing protein [Planosporangium thailandense]
MDTDAAAQGKPTLQIGVEPVGRGEVTVSVRGELDCATNGQLRAALTELLNRGGLTAIGLDLRGLEFIDSTGIGTLVVAQRICREMGVRLRLTAVNAFAARVLGVVGVDAALGLPATATDAAALVGAD